MFSMTEKLYRSIPFTPPDPKSFPHSPYLFPSPPLSSISNPIQSTLVPSPKARLPISPFLLRYPKVQSCHREIQIVEGAIQSRVLPSQWERWKLLLCMTERDEDWSLGHSDRSEEEKGLKDIFIGPLYEGNDEFISLLIGLIPSFIEEIKRGGFYELTCPIPLLRSHDSNPDLV